MNVLAEEEEVKTKLQQKKIMIVDDDTAFLEELSEALTLNGYAVITVNAAAEAIPTAERTRPDIILLDLKMPGKSGFQIATEFQRLEEFTRVPIIAMTGHYTDNEYNSLLRICGIRTCLNKPFNPQEAIKTIKVILTLNNPNLF